MTCLSPLQLPAPPSLSADDLATHSTENKEEPSAVPDGSHLPSPPSNSHPAGLHSPPLFLFLLSVCPAPSKASPSSWAGESILCHLFREFFFYSHFSSAVSLPPESFPSATDQRDLVSSIFHFPPYFAPFLWFLLELQYSEELIYAHYLHFLICIHSSI